MPQAMAAFYQLAIPQNTMFFFILILLQLSDGAKVPKFRFPDDTGNGTFPPRKNPPQPTVENEEEYEYEDDYYTTEESDCGQDSTYCVKPANYPQEQLQARVANWPKFRTKW
jgi:hypothetical protein